MVPRVLAPYVRVFGEEAGSEGRLFCRDIVDGRGGPWRARRRGFVGRHELGVGGEFEEVDMDRK